MKRKKMILCNRELPSKKKQQAILIGPLTKNHDIFIFLKHEHFLPNMGLW
jgi:hypothetical protein